MLRKDIPRTFTPSLDPAEVARFNALAAQWRNPDGVFRAVHAFNRARVAWLVRSLGPLAPAERKIIDVGCATGLVSEELARLGGEVTGIDASERNIAIAQTCAREAGLDITYEVATPEKMAGDKPCHYTHALALEVVEHVADVTAFLDGVFGCVRPDGRVVVATLNRTWRSWLLGIVLAEYVLKWLPRGTHEWARFVTPQELDRIAARHGFVREVQTGLIFNPFAWRWTTMRSLAVNYMIVYCQPTA